MNEQHSDALPPIKLDQAPDNQEQATGGEKPGAIPQPAAAPMVSLAAPTADDPVAASPVPAIADDVDLIEKEWVEKAKQIVEQTKHDPYQQNEAITKVKVDYLKKRYNREVKKPEE